MPTADRHASWLELFFDLVFVAAVAALATGLHDDHSVRGLAVFAGLFVPVWWAWRSYTWYAAGFDTDDGLYRLGLFAAMLGVAVLAASLDGAAHGNSETFAAAYAGLFYLLSALYARAGRQMPAARPLTARYMIGHALGATLWLASLALPEEVRPLMWGVAMLVLLATPVFVLSVPYRSYDAAHIAERYGLFTILVLGESIIVTVTGLDTGSSVPAAAVALLGLLIAATIWWLYFGRFRSMPDSGPTARFAWAQGHLLVFAGIAAAAVGIEFAVEAAAEETPFDVAARLPLGAGLAAYLVAMAMIRGATRRGDWVVLMRLAGAAAILALVVAGGALGPLGVVTGVSVLLVVEAAIELRRAPP